METYNIEADAIFKLGFAFLSFTSTFPSSNSFFRNERE